MRIPFQLPDPLGGGDRQHIQRLLLCPPKLLRQVARINPVKFAVVRSADEILKTLRIILVQTMPYQAGGYISSAI